MSEELEDKKLIQKYLKGEIQALDFLITRYFKVIYSFIYKNVGDQSSAEDITQEVFIRVWKNIKKFNQDKSFKPWLFQIAKNASIDFLRKKKTIPFSKFENEKGQNILLDNIAAAPLNLLNNLSDKKILTSAMRGLTYKEQVIISLRHNDGLSFREISEKLNESINTIKSRYRRGLLNLRKNIKDA